MEKPSEIKTLQQAIQYYSDEQVCISTVAAARWPNSPVCPACEHKEHWYLKSQKRWKCKECHKQFTVKLGTIFEDSPIPLTKWLPAMWLIASCKNGISSYEISRSIGVTQKSAWFMLHRIRLAFRSGTIEKLGGNGGNVECDEVYIGGNPARMHKNRRIALQRARTETGHFPNKTVVFGMLDRESRKVRTGVMANVRRDVLQEHILEHVEHGTNIHTDEATFYNWLNHGEEYVHKVINHASEYVRGQVHTNGIENFWSLLKRTLRGTYVAVEPFHLERYVDEQVFRFNHRKHENGEKISDYERFQIALSQIAGKRLTFAEVTGKVGETAS